MQHPSDFRIVFMGSPDFAVPALHELHQRGFTISAVVSGSDKRRGRGNELTPTPVKSAALELGLPIIEADDLRAETLRQQLLLQQADLFVVVAFRILPKSLLNIPRVGSVNLHGSLLPKYRGAAPIHRAVMNGESETGATIFMLDEQVDTGKYLAQLKISIGENDTTGDVYTRMMHQGAELLGRTVLDIFNGSYSLTAQDDTQATSAPKIFADDCLIDFSKSSAQVHNQIRGLNPFPVAYTWLDGKRLKVWSSLNRHNIALGEGILTATPHEVLVGCGQGAVSLLEIQLEGKKRMAATDFFRGYSGEGKLSSLPTV